MAGETASWFSPLVRHYGLRFFEGTRSAEIFDLQLEQLDLLEQLPTLFGQRAFAAASWRGEVNCSGYRWD